MPYVRNRHSVYSPIFCPFNPLSKTNKKIQQKYFGVFSSNVRKHIENKNLIFFFKSNIISATCYRYIRNSSIKPWQYVNIHVYSNREHNLPSNYTVCTILQTNLYQNSVKNLQSYIFHWKISSIFQQKIQKFSLIKIPGISLAQNSTLT